MWRRNHKVHGLLSSNRISFLVLTCIAGLAVGQYFDPEVNDKVYLDNLQKQIEVEVNTTREELYTQARVIEDITKQFVAAQLKENLFIALRVLAEKELQELDEEKKRIVLLKNVKEHSPKDKTGERRPKQDDGDDDDGDGSIATTLRPVDTVPFQMGLIPQVANLVKAIFGGNQNVNLTSYVSSATRLLPKPVGNQVVGLVGLLSTPSKNPMQGAAQVGVVRRTQYNTNRPALVAVALPQNNQAQLQRVQTQSSPQVNISSYYQQSEEPELNNFQNLFNEVGLIKAGATATARPYKRTTDKTYVYNTSGSKGVAGVSASVRPLAAKPVRPPPKYTVSGQQRVQQQPSSLLNEVQLQQIPQNQVQLEQFQIPQSQQQEVKLQGQQQASVNLIQPQLQQGSINPIQTQQPQGQFQGQSNPQQQSPVFPPRAPAPQIVPNVDEDEDEDEDEDGRKRQFSLGSLLPSLLGTVFRSTPAPVAVQNPPLVQAAAAAEAVTATGTSGTNQASVNQQLTAATFPAATMMAQGFNLRTFAMDVGKNLGDIFRVMPDIFRGAREGVQFLQTLSSVFGGLDGLGSIADLGGIL